MNKVEQLINEINEEIKPYKKYEPSSNIDEGVMLISNVPLYKKKYFAYVVIPLVITTLLIVLRPNFIYTKNTNKKKKTKTLNNKNLVVSVILLSGFVSCIYYFIHKNYFIK